MEPTKQPQASSGTDGLVTSIVNDIPVETQGGAGAQKDDADLDRIMHEVGTDVKKVGAKRPKKHFDFFKHKPKPAKTEAKFHAQPIPAQKTAAPAAPPARSASQSPAAAAKPAQKIKPAAQPKPPKNKSGAPVMAITMAVIVTGALIAAAYYAYK